MVDAADVLVLKVPTHPDAHVSKCMQGEIKQPRPRWGHLLIPVPDITPTHACNDMRSASTSHLLILDRDGAVLGAGRQARERGRMQVQGGRGARAAHTGDQGRNGILETGSKDTTPVCMIGSGSRSHVQICWPAPIQDSRQLGECRHRAACSHAPHMGPYLQESTTCTTMLDGAGRQAACEQECKQEQEITR